MYYPHPRPFSHKWEKGVSRYQRLLLFSSTTYGRVLWVRAIKCHFFKDFSYNQGSKNHFLTETK